MRYLDGPRPRLFAHRGASGCTPENTIEAFDDGLKSGADRLELDVHATRDGHIVVFHDELLDRTTDGAGFVRERTLEELKTLDAGFRFKDERGGYPFRGKGIRIPTLAEVLDAFPGVPLNIEVKDDAAGGVELTVNLIRRHRALARVLLAAFEDPIIKKLRELEPSATTSLSAAEVATFLTSFLTGNLDTWKSPGLALQVPPTHEGVEIVTADSVRAAHEFGMEVHVWTINDEAEMQRLLDLGIDGLMSDFPARATAVMAGRGLRA